MDGHFTLTLDVRTAEGTAVPDGQCTVNIKQNGHDWRRVEAKTTNGHLAMEIPMPNPPTPLSWEILCDRFHPHTGEFFMPREGTSQPFTATVFRIPGQWTPKFTALKDLASPRFDRFRSVVAVSNSVDLKTGGNLGDLSAMFDDLSGEPAVLGKMALLNLHSVLVDEHDPIAQFAWFDHVKRIVRLDRERFIAEVDPGLYENVQTIINDIATWKAKGYFLEASSCLHNGNLPAAYPAPAEPTISVKWHYQQGNLQLTMTFIRGSGRAIHLLDCDLDEHANLVLHAADIGEHDFTGGTAPVEMFDYISLHSAKTQADRVSRCDIGYVLV